MLERATQELAINICLLFVCLFVCFVFFTFSSGDGKQCHYFILLTNINLVIEFLKL